MKADDRFDLVELNDRFVNRLRERFATEPVFQAVANRATVFHQPVEQLADEHAYDAIVCGLPFNNFPAATVEHLLGAISRLAKPGGTLSFFEYVGVRPLRGLVSNRVERQRLRGVGRAIAAVRDGRQIRKDLILANVPPAWVHHVRFI
jgi:phospholipid N-methyltransferase